MLKTIFPALALIALLLSSPPVKAQVATPPNDVSTTQIALLKAMLEEMKQQREELQKLRNDIKRLIQINTQASFLATELRSQQNRVYEISEEINSLKISLQQAADLTQDEEQVERAKAAISTAKTEIERYQAIKTYEEMRLNFEARKLSAKQEAERGLARKQQLENELLPAEKAKLAGLESKLADLERDLQR